MRTLVGDLIEFSRVASDTAPHHAVNMNAVARRILVTHAGLVRDTQALLDVRDVPEVRGNPEHPELVLLHLLHNALLYRKVGVPARIEVNARRLACGWKSGVHDDGIGILMEYAARVFQIFRSLTRDRA